MTIKQKQKRLEQLYEDIGWFLSIEAMQLIANIVELEIELTAEDGR